MNQILIITVNYKNTTVTENFIRSLEKLDGCEQVNLVIVDSESTVRSKERLEILVKSTPVKTKLIFSERNTYYWGGVALALESLQLSYNGNPYWIIACNNDIIFSQRLFFKKLSKLDPRKYPVIGPTILSSVTGKNLNPHMDKPIGIIKKLYLFCFYVNHISARIMQVSLRKLKQFFVIFKRPTASIMKKIYAPHGSFIIFSKQYFKSSGWIDSNYEMYGEEVTTAEIAKKNKIPIFFIPELEVMHVIHSSTTGHSWKKEFNYAKAAYLYYKNAYF